MVCQVKEEGALSHAWNSNRNAQHPNGNESLECKAPEPADPRRTEGYFIHEGDLGCQFPLCLGNKNRHINLFAMCMMPSLQ